MEFDLHKTLIMSAVRFKDESREQLPWLTFHMIITEENYKQEAGFKMTCSTSATWFRDQDACHQTSQPEQSLEPTVEGGN